MTHDEHQATVDAAAELMNKHHDAIDTINEALAVINDTGRSLFIRVGVAREILRAFQSRWDSA